MQLISRKEFLGVFSGFKKLPPNLVEEILLTSAYKSFSKDAFIYREGDRCTGIGLFLSREVRVHKIGGGGREVTLYEIYPGDTCILNASSILANKAYIF